MTVIPNFILRRMYRNGSFRRLLDGIGFDITNTLGPGQISKINSISLNGTAYAPQQILLLIQEDRLPAASISEENPATFFLNQTITCLIQGVDLPGGKYEITLDLVSREAGKVTLTISDQLA